MSCRPACDVLFVEMKVMNVINLVMTELGYVRLVITPVKILCWRYYLGVGMLNLLKQTPFLLVYLTTVSQRCECREMILEGELRML